jgi:hypothetical protein
MRKIQGSERLDNHLRHRLSIPAPAPGCRVLVALRDCAQRMDVTAGLVLAGYRVLLASAPKRMGDLVGAVDVVVADGRFVAGLGRSTHESLRRSVFIAVCEEGTPTPLAARARFTRPFDIDDLVTAVMMLARPRTPTRVVRPRTIRVGRPHGA